MEPLLARVTQQAMNYAIRSGIAITASYALKQSARLIRESEAALPERDELRRLRDVLEGRIRILGPAVDLVEVISARGNSSLETAVALTKSIRWDVQTLGNKIAAAADENPRSDTHTGQQIRLRQIISDIKSLLSRIDDAVQLINLAITTSGANLSSGLPPSISPSRLLQASTFVTAGDTQYVMSNSNLVQIGPTFTLSLYMLFAGHVRPQNDADVRQSTWKEVLHKARVKLVRVPLSQLHDLPAWSAESELCRPTAGARSRNDEFGYQILIIEDRDDGRVHDDDEPSSSYGGVGSAGIREFLPIHEISKIFYADTGKILNIGDDMQASSPVLLLKRDLNAIPPRRMMERQEVSDSWDDPLPEEQNMDKTSQSEVDDQILRESRANSLAPENPPASTNETSDTRWRFPRDLDAEWLAFEVYVEDHDSETESDCDEKEPNTERSREGSQGPSTLDAAMSKLNVSSPNPSEAHDTPSKYASLSPLASFTNQNFGHNPVMPQIRTSLSLLHTMLRLLSLQQFQQCSHLSIPDELLSFFLSDATSTTGVAQGDEFERRRLRSQARQRLGFDPYDESPIKRRGEDYQRYREDDRENAGDGWSESGHLDHRAEGNEVDRSAWTTWGPRWSRKFTPDLNSVTGRRTSDEGYETQTAAASPLAQKSLDRASLPPSLPASRARRSEASAKQRSMGAIDHEENQSPSVRARQQQLRSRGSGHRSSPLASVEGTE